MEHAVAPVDPDRRWCWLERGSLASFGALYLVVVGRAAVTVDGRRTFTLFDDAMISMRYGRNLAGGEGLVFNVGEQVEGYTNLLWTVVMALVHVVVPDPAYAPLVVSLIGVVVLVAQLQLTRLAVARTTSCAWAPTLAVLGVGASWALVFWTLRGMEVGLLGLLVTSALIVVHVELNWSATTRFVVVTALLVAAVFTRDDAVVLAIAVAASAVWAAPARSRWRVAAGAAVALVLAVATRLAVRLVLYGELLPNTYRLKVEGVPRFLLVERGALSTGYTLAFGLAVLVALGCASWGAGRLARSAMCVVVAQFAYAMLVGGDAWEDRGFASRFVATVTAPLVIAAVLGVVAIARGAASRRSVAVGIAVVFAALGWAVLVPATNRYFQLGHGGPGLQAVRAITLVVTALAMAASLRERWRPAAVLVLALLVVGAPNVVPWTDWVRSDQPFDTDEGRWARYGAALNAALPPGSSVAVASIGNIGYFSDRPIVDLLGKIDPVVAGTAPRTDFWALPGHLRWDYRRSVVELRPDLVGQLFATVPADIEMIRAAGYREVAPMVFLREGARVTSDEALARANSLAY